MSTKEGLLKQRLKIIELASRIPYYAADENFSSVEVLFREVRRAIDVYNYMKDEAKKHGYDT